MSSVVFFFYQLWSTNPGIAEATFIFGQLGNKQELGQEFWEIKTLKNLY